jgi:predicted N-formylglutamate amidohydrolase
VSPRTVVVVTCEHGGNRIPRRWSGHFRGQKARLASHRGWDPGAKPVAEGLARALGAPLIVATTSRLLVDLNRSVGHPALFSAVTRELPEEERTRIVREIHEPHWSRVERTIERARRRGLFVLHLAVHSFTPVLGGVTRRADLGLLYDPGRHTERALCERWQRTLREAAPGLVVRRNYPYRGVSDGLTKELRRRRPASAYAGIEIEMNQRLFGAPGAAARIARLLLASLAVARDWA